VTVADRERPGVSRGEWHEDGTPSCRAAFRNVLGTVMVETAVRGHHARTGMSHAIVGVARCRLP
jgi:hypothetical protein